MLLDLLKGSLAWLETCTEERLREKYWQEHLRVKSNFSSLEENGSKNPEKFGLDALLKKLDEPSITEEPEGRDITDLPFDIDALVARIDAKIAELECEEQHAQEIHSDETSQGSTHVSQMSKTDGKVLPLDGKNIIEEERRESFAWIRELAPEREYSLEYGFEYIKTILHFLIDMEDVDAYDTMLNERAKGAIVRMQNNSLCPIYLALVDMITSLCIDNKQDIKEHISGIKWRIRRELRKRQT